MDFVTDIAPILISVGVGAIPVVGGVLAAGINTALKQRNLDTMWFETVARAGGVAYNALVQSGRPVTDKTALTQAAAAGAAYLVRRLPDQLKARQLSGEDLTHIAKAELGRLLATDINVSPAPAPIPSTTASAVAPADTGGDKS